MILYRIVKSLARTNDLSGIGAFNVGGRWNSVGTYALYCSESISLALLENLVHFDAMLVPPDLFIMKIEVNANAKVLTIPDKHYPKDWLHPDLLQNKKLGDELLHKHHYVGIRVRSAVNPEEYNVLLDPLFPQFHRLVKVIDVKPLAVDMRLRR